MEKQYAAIKCRLKPTSEQTALLMEWCDINRFVWNHFLEANKVKYAQEKKFVFYQEMQNSLPAMKKTHLFLKKPPAHAPQAICRRLEAAIKRVWQTGAGFPQFKSKKKGDLPSIYIPQIDTAIKWTKNRISIPKLGWVKWTKHRPLPGKLKSITLKYDGGYWWCVGLVKVRDKVKPLSGDTIGLDVGLTNWVITSDSEVFDLHPALVTREQQVVEKQRALSHKQRGSANRSKARQKLNLAYYRVRCARHDNAHKVSTAIAKRHTHVHMENLNIKGMQRNRHLARRIAQVAWGQLRQYLGYKTNVVLVDRWYPSSQLCSSCGHRQKMPLDVRRYDCPSCSLSLDRDINAAINLRNWTKKNTTGAVGIHACGDTSAGDEPMGSSRYVSQKQEKFKACMGSNSDAFGLEAHGSLARG